MYNRPFDKPLLEKLKKGELKVRYPKGYGKWRQRFFDELRKNGGNVKEAMDKIHGRPSAPEVPKT